MTNCHGHREWTHNGISVLACERCGFTHQNPIPSAASVAAFYRRGYYEERKPTYLAAVRRDWAHIQLWVQTKKKIIERLCPENPENPDRSVLDIGSSIGQFLAPFAATGWRAVGVEPSAEAAAEARRLKGVTVHETLIEDVSDDDLAAPFDVVHMREALNHVRDPIGLLRRVRESLLREGGHLVVEVSNDFNPLQEAYVEQAGSPRWWITPDHISYFDTRSLSGLLERCGFEVVQSLATFPMELFLLMGDDYRADRSLGRICHQRRMHFEKQINEAGFTEAWIRMSEGWARAGVGRSTLLFARLRI